MLNASIAFARPHDFVAAGRGRLAYWRFGQGPDVVLVHGWPLTAATFRHLAPALAQKYTLHLFDLPGVGHSEWSGPIGFVTHAAALRAAIDTLGLQRYALVAHDSGGTIARLVAADDPRAVALVLGNTVRAWPGSCSPACAGASCAARSSASAASSPIRRTSTANSARCSCARS